MFNSIKSSLPTSVKNKGKHVFLLSFYVSHPKTRKTKNTKENKIKMGYFKPRNMHLLEHGSNQNFFFKPRKQEHNICKYSSRFSYTHPKTFSKPTPLTPYQKSLSFFKPKKPNSTQTPTSF